MLNGEMLPKRALCIKIPNAHLLKFCCNEFEIILKDEKGTTHFLVNHDTYRLI